MTDDLRTLTTVRALYGLALYVHRRTGVVPQPMLRQSWKYPHHFSHVLAIGMPFGLAWTIEPTADSREYVINGMAPMGLVEARRYIVEAIRERRRTA